MKNLLLFQGHLSQRFVDQKIYTENFRFVDLVHQFSVLVLAVAIPGYQVLFLFFFWGGGGVTLILSKRRGGAQLGLIFRLSNSIVSQPSKCLKF